MEAGRYVFGMYIAPKPARDLLIAIVGFEVGFNRVAQLALVAHSSRNCRNPDLAVAIVEICILPRGVLLLLRCFHIHNLELRSVLVRPR